MKIIADLHLHSKYSRAVSSKMNLPTIAEWARKKGIGLVATGDWTHPVWFRELQANLVEASEGLYKLKRQKGSKPLFLLSTELSCIYSQGEKGRRIHTLFLAPNLEVVEKVNRELLTRGFNLMSDGRPILGLSMEALSELVLSIDERSIIIPAHIWTPWFSLYGSKSGFDSIDECFGNFSKYIYAVETGLSSDPAMNWRIEELEKRNIVSFGDAHSPQKLGREATVFELSSLSYENIGKALKAVDNIQQKAGERILYTIEFYPEEGKYHYTGHRNCGVVYSPKEARKKGLSCPVCGKPLTVGVMSRVEGLASQEIEIETELDEFGITWVGDKNKKRSSYIMLVPLIEILAEVYSSGVGTKTVLAPYEQLINTFGSEFEVLLQTPLAEIEKVVGSRVSEAIKKVRAGDIAIRPGYDGVFGKVQIWKEQEEKKDNHIDQTALF